MDSNSLNNNKYNATFLKFVNIVKIFSDILLTSIPIFVIL